MIVTLRVTSPAEAKTAVKMIEAYLATFESETVEEVVPKETKPAVKAKVTPKKVSEPKKEVKKTPEPSSATLSEADIKVEAMEAKTRCGDAGEVKKVISKYGSRISAVKESDYEALITELRGL